MPDQRRSSGLCVVADMMSDAIWQVPRARILIEKRRIGLRNSVCYRLKSGKHFLRFAKVFEWDELANSRPDRVTAISETIRSVRPIWRLRREARSCRLFECRARRG